MQRRWCRCEGEEVEFVWNDQLRILDIFLLLRCDLEVLIVKEYVCTGFLLIFSISLLYGAGYSI